jgi:hypothetical protein
MNAAHRVFIVLGGIGLGLVSVGGVFASDGAMTILRAYQGEFISAIVRGDVVKVSESIVTANTFSSSGKIVIMLSPDDAVLAAVEIKDKASRLAIITLLCDAAWDYYSINHNSNQREKFNQWIGALDVHGRTVLHKVIELQAEGCLVGDDYATLKQLLRCKAPSGLVNSDGKTVLDLAQGIAEKSLIEAAIAEVEAELMLAGIAIQAPSDEPFTFGSAAAAA